MSNLTIADLYCWEKMEAPTMEEYRAFIEELYQFNLPVCVAERDVYKWKKFYTYIKDVKPSDALLYCLVPEMIVVQQFYWVKKIVGGKEFKIATFCDRCHEDDSSKRDSIKEYGGPKSVLDFLMDETNYCFKCSDKLFHIMDSQYKEFF